MTVGIDNPAFEDFKDDKLERDENSNDLNIFVAPPPELFTDSEEDAETTDFGSESTAVVQMSPAGNQIIKCRITRDRKGIEAFGYPTYFMYMDTSEGEPTNLILTARKRKTGNSSYIISTDFDSLNTDKYMAKLKGNNMIGTRFTCYGNGRKFEATDVIRTSPDDSLQTELVSVLYDQNVLGFKGPRKMTVVLPRMKEDKEPVVIRPISSQETLLGRFDEADLREISVHHNRQPNWNEKTQSYVLNFNGRVTQASVKNFQITEADDPQTTIMQFGRIRNDNFTMDYRYPLTAVQAFGIALSSFDPKIACE